MIRARMDGLLLLGIDAENVKRLKDGKPIHVHQAEVDNGVPITQVVITYGETLQHIVDEMKRAGVVPPDFVAPTPSRATQQ